MDTPLFLDETRFRMEWRQAIDQIDERYQTIIMAIVDGQQQSANIARQHEISRERVRQIYVIARNHIKRYAARFPEGELSHTAFAVTRWAEIAGLFNVFQYRRRIHTARAQLSPALTRLGCITDQQHQLVPAACLLTDIPSGPRPNLEPLTKSLKRLIAEHPDGITDPQARQLLPQWSDRINHWPELDLAQHALAHIGAHVDQDGVMTPPDDWMPPASRETEYLKRAMATVLEQAGDCLTLWQIIAATKALYSAGDTPSIPEDRARRLLNGDPRFNWVGSSRYGLTKWSIGLSQPQPRKGHRRQVSDEIEHLLMQAGKPLTKQEILDHISQRLRVSEGAVTYALSAKPHFITDGNLVSLDQAHLMRSS